MLRHGITVIPEPADVSPGRKLVIPLGGNRNQMSISNRGCMAGMVGGHKYGGGWWLKNTECVGFKKSLGASSNRLKFIKNTLLLNAKKVRWTCPSLPGLMPCRASTIQIIAILG